MAKDNKKTLRDIHDVPWLLKPHVHIKSPEKVIQKINCIVQGGKEKLQVIFDFDRTLTKMHENGVPTLSSFCVLESFPALPENFQEKSQANADKYLQIEFDPNLTIEQKTPHMVEWWLKWIEMLKGTKWDPIAVEEWLRKKHQPFRDGTSVCFDRLCSAKIPVLVFSAGVGDVVQLSLRIENLLTPNVHIVSNFLKFKDGSITGYDGDIIHVFNKNEHMIENTSYFEELTGRSNVILLGDSTGDTKMADGIPHDTVLKIGFLNTRIEESLEQYKNLFDIVLTDDQTMDVLNQILKLMFF